MWYVKNEKRHKLNNEKYRLKRNYNMTLEDYEKMKEKQNNKCLICNRKFKLLIDHNHKTGEIRGLLCAICNRNIGWLEKHMKIIFDYLSIKMQENSDLE